MKIIGLTGGIASGKSTVAKLFSEFGFQVIDADEIARDLRKPGGAAYDAILARFGTADPKRLREIIFSDLQARLDLEAILHPLIQAESARRIQKFSRDSFVIYEAALLAEAGRHKDFDALIVVTSDATTRQTRLTARDSISIELAGKIISSQSQDEDRKKVATHLIENTGTLEDLRKKVKELTQKLGKP